MTTCFIFIKYLSEEGCLSLSLDDQNQVLSPPEQRTFAEIRLLQKNAQTVVIAPAEQFAFHKIELPWLTEKKARTALPYALEDRTAENVEELHFAFDRNHYQDGHYLVVVVRRQYLQDLLAKFAQENINFQHLTVDWFALTDHEICLWENGLLVNDDSFCGALALEFSQLYLQQMSTEQTLYTFKNVKPPIPIESSVTIDERPENWLAGRLIKNKAMDICQGEFAQKNNGAKLKQFYYAAAIMSVLWIVSVLTVDAVKLHLLNKKTAELDTDIAVIYRQYFPQAQQVISPRFRIEQLLKTQGGNDDQIFWSLLNTLTRSIKNNTSVVEQIKYENQSMQVVLVSEDFDTLEKLQTALQKSAINVRQLQASTRNEKVVSTLELKP